jgi:3-dehydroquinate dehydratase-1
MATLQHLLSKGRPLIVGTFHDSSGLKWLGGATKTALRQLDVLEARLDALDGLKLPKKWPLPMIATARHPGEGGIGNLAQSKRRQLLEEAIPWASAIDIELRSSKTLAPVVALAHQAGSTVILSHHDFNSTPSRAVLKKLASRAAAEGADVFKVATMLREPKDLQRLIELQLSSPGIPVVLMGMGGAGRFSRLVLSGFGSPLCYGWLGRPQVSGQWPALRLRGLLDEVLPS